ncbi:MAG: sugar phosphorylase [Egibacteraceae bacterium]
MAVFVSTSAVIAGGARIRRCLDALYPPDVAARTHRRLALLIERFTREHRLAGRAALFDQTDVVLITYADQIREPGRPPLQTLREFLRVHVRGAISGVHLLPFHPSSSDDGFSVMDYRLVDPAVGGWPDVRAIADDFRLMVDGVFNHVSARGRWFKEWLAGHPSRCDFFHVVDPATDLSAVTRPRTSSPLTPVETPNGLRHLWTTFSADQIDLNYANPRVLIESVRTLLDFVRCGAGMVRLDAVAFLWKQIGTSCVHLPRTHAIIRLWRAVLDAAAPGMLVLTETNVPHAESLRYWGDGTDEAHLVYQFALPPLVLAAFHLTDAGPLRDWAAGLRAPSDQTTFFNVLASHDGIGLRPVEGILTPAEIEQLGALAIARGGSVSYRARPDGGLSPYELNVMYFDALTDDTEPQQRQVDRFVCAHSVLLALAGIPGIYIHSLLGSRNWSEGVTASGQPRSVNREKFDRSSLEAELSDPSSLRHQVCSRLLDRIRVRVAEPAFHPNGPQTVIDGPAPLFTVARASPDGSSRVLCVHNLSGCCQTVVAGPTRGVHANGVLDDLCAPGYTVQVAPDGQVEVDVAPYGVRWLKQRA